MVLLRPESELADLQSEIERFFGSAFGGGLAPSARGVYPAVNIFDDGSDIVVKCELPGIRMDDVDLIVEDNKLTIRGKRAIQYAENVRFHRREREQGAFRRVVQLPARLDSEGAKASYRHGVLTVTIPKHAEAKPRKITVATADA